MIFLLSPGNSFLQDMMFILAACLQTDHYHPVWGEMDNYTVGKEKRKQLLLMLCQHEADRLDVWAQPISSK